MARVKEHSEEWAAGQGLILTESQMVKNLQAENILLRKKLDYYLNKPACITCPKCGCVIKNI